jgi:hypothetical protein
VRSRTWCRPFSRLALHRGPAGVVSLFDAAQRPALASVLSRRACRHLAHDKER